MPHYADGIEAKVGDQVFGRLYNSGPGKKAGVIISITPGAESCKAMVQFTEIVAEGEPSPRMAVSQVEEPRRTFSRAIRGEVHGTAGAHFIAYVCAVCADYCATNELQKVE